MNEFQLNRRQILVGASVLGAGAVAAMSSGRLAFAAQGKILRVQNDKDISVIDPANRSGWWEETAMFAIFQGLIQYKSGTEWEWRLDAAEELDATDPVAIKFRLKKGLQWTNGFGELTSADVKFSYERIGDPKYNAGYQTDWAPLKEVEIIDKYSGIIRLTKPFPPLFRSTLPHGSGLIVCKAALEKNNNTMTTDPFATSGPYKIGQWLPREKLILVRNELWAGDKPYFDEIHLVPITDLKTAEIGFQSGDLDVTKVSMSSIPQMKAAADPNVQMRALPALKYIWMGINVEHPKLKDLKIRRAIQQGVDVPTVIQAAYFGEAAVAYGTVPPSVPGHRSKNIYPFDPAASKKLLAEAGATNLKIRLDLPADTDRITMAQVIQSQLKEVGIEIEVNPMDRGAFEEQFMESHGDAWKDTQMFIVEFSTPPDASWATTWLTCSQVGSWNWQRLCDKDYDAINDKATYELDDKQRTADFIKAQDMLEESGAYVFLTHGSNVWVNHPSLNAALSPDGQWLILRDVAAA
ncbi:peptide ABC transporter substrate-binding protein [Oleomonas cavernae]|uniref:Peptide ABC transporter substrate-binding protein n=1 Tax=Oleomonas cavernae TaxID=2320859 RepID=A0A418WU05_9PROT|nr:ABC transporter substrate-binding protein [Oleomonas cavernae]RJF94744.1 peptide ABC transporter substrate-binding protein [Oleomonas cavernae]